MMLLNIQRPLISLAAFCVASALAADSEQWRSRSIYQLITDRFALPEGVDPDVCDPGKQTWCGGTWNSIRENLDYIQDAGFTAIWISPIAENYEGPRTAYGDAYHGYWIQNNRKLNGRFGTAEDLKALSAELHKRDMFLMVDVVVNNVMSTSTTPDFSKYMFTNQSNYHKYCPVVFGDPYSERDCWLGDTNVTLPDVKTGDQQVQTVYGDWIAELVKEYNIDGLRIDAAKHTETNFWGPFCKKAGVFCMGEVFGDDLAHASTYQGPESLDSILNFPMYNALVQAFTIPGERNISAVANILSESRKSFKDIGLLGNFIENQDLPRWANTSTDPQSKWNAMVFNFMSEGIPVVYYGQEAQVDGQEFAGVHDPWNREPLWPSKYLNTSRTYELVSKLNQFRNFLVRKPEAQWLKAQAQVLTVNEFGMGFSRGRVNTVVTTVGSPPANASIAIHTMLGPTTVTIDIITCRQYITASGGTLSIEYTKGGVPIVLIPSEDLLDSGICGNTLQSAAQTLPKESSAPGALWPNLLSFFFFVSGLVVCVL